MTVYQTDTKSVETPAPASEASPTVTADEVIDEPVVVNADKAKAEKANDITDIMNKWGVKD